MKKIAILILICCLGKDLIGQPPIKRAGNANTVEDYNLFILKSFRPPVFADTTAANLSITLDSCGKIIFTYDGNKLWKRQCNPKIWVEIGSGGSGGSDSISVLSTVTQISSLSRANINQLVVTDTIRGGNFNLYAGSDAADGGMIFEDGVGRKWIRQWNKVDPINVQWFGFVPDGVTDNYANFVALKTWLINHRAKSDPGNPAYTYFAKLHPIFFPAAFNYYYFSQTLNFEYTCTILGSEGGGNTWSSKLLFPADSIAFSLWFVDQYGASGTSSNGNSVKNIAIYAINDGSLDTTAHGFKVRAPSEFENVSVEGFGGNGFDFNSTDPITTNVDFCILRNCRGYYNWNGLFIKGGEANVIRVYDCDFSINRKWGVYDIGFLGNFYYNCHVAVSGVVAGQKTYVIHRTGGIGIRYQYAAKRDGFLTMPGDSTGWENDWVLIGDSTQFHYGSAADYLAGTYYWVGGSYYLETGTLTNCYDEGGQMGRYLGLYAASRGGIHGAGFQWNNIGVFESWQSGQMNLSLSGAAYTVGTIGLNYSRLKMDDLTFFKSSGQGLRIKYDTTSNFGQFVDLGTGTSRTYLTSAAATPATYGRTSFLDGVLYNIGGSYIGSFDDSKANLIVYGTTVPSTGTWSQGDLVIKRNVSATDTYGWRCTVGGTPGTWETLTFGGGGTPAGNYGNVQLNRNSAFATPASDSLDFDGGLIVKGVGTFDRSATIGSTNTPDATSPLTVDAASTNTAYLLQMGKNGNPAYFRIDKDGNIVDVGGGTARIFSSGGKPYFPDGFSSATWTSSANGNVVLKSDWSGTLPWVIYGAASTTDNQVGLVVVGSNATTKGDLQQWADKDFTILSVVDKDGKFGAGVASPTAFMHLKAGTATANTAPIKLNTGTALTTPEDGAIEYHGSHIYFTIGSTRYQLDQQAGTNLGNSNLTQTGGNRTYTGAGQNLIFNGSGGTSLFNVEYNAIVLTAQNSGVNIQGDSILISANVGKVYIDSLPPSIDAIDSVVVITPTGQLKQKAQSDLVGGLLSGTYTPTLTNVANVAASTAYSCQYSRVGSVVTVSGEVDIDPTTTLTLTQLGISLPIASNLTATNELGGTSADDLGTAARVAGDATNNRAEVRMTPVDVTNRRFSFTFTYRIL